MKYKLLKDLPLAKAGTEVEISDTNFFYRGELDIHLPDDNGRPHCIANIKLENQKEWLEEIKEPKTIYDLKKGDKYYVLDDGNDITKYEVPYNKYFNSKFYLFNCFVTEREAKLNKLLRELATRTDKWLPTSQYEEFTTWYGDRSSWDGDEFDIIHYNMGLVFRNVEEYNKYMTEETKDLLFKL